MTLAEDRERGLAEERQRPVLVGYGDDPYSWALEQAELLRDGRLDLIDAANLADEITTLVHYLADKLRSDLSRILQHLLEWDHQTEVRSRSWCLSITEHRRRVVEHLEGGPGLKSILPKLLAEAYRNGRRYALDETGLPQRAMPETCPYAWDEIMHRPIEWPETP
ncbi:DUF29 domain-containing protein [Lichenihabitans sp. Uapishka_5]|uniref:DUF29 domain-containing protein n=1 Tax=Lichenihabitans sp. Uapishka_5 TaxID=3037302 RepID=UPI0029E82873|nr:DUF29 domain-containing protein [Lichenihabitans sp. Uapishka_5]MDX7952577.1 DUF29 domain-containing protein [Lichenihabitans sp. Uapishka_5]